MAKEAGLDKRNKLYFGLGTIGRDMYYAMVSMYLMVYLSEALKLSDVHLLVMTAMLTGLRVFDAVNDPLMGMIVDNTRGKFGKFKPGILFGAITGAILLVLMFSGLGYNPAGSIVGYAVIFGILYLAWDIFYGLNDIAYWSMLPSLTTDQRERERMGSFARICASLGGLVVIVSIIPATNSLGAALGGTKQGWLAMAVMVSVLMIGFQLFTLIGVKERRGAYKEEEKTGLIEMFKVLFKNDQLMWVALAMALYMTGNATTMAFGVHYFKYIFGDENMYAIFAGVLGVSQLTAMAIFPAVRSRMTRKRLYSISICMAVAGYLGFFFLPNNIILIGAAGVLIFTANAFINILILMFLSDTIEYGQWKLGKRNESITFSVQPFINKIGSALGNGVLGVTLVWSGVNRAESAADITPAGATIFKLAMMILPLTLITVGFIIYLLKYKISEQRYANILSELQQRGDLKKSAD
ncbi:MAG: glycoside-pentoside-hexuronide (GPH):cation symporter [Treponema sp.]|jgi:melibiose permease/lactose/raffinose/galactose permease|nr:glycoside-pentoside-hexuronide (GPH):cation symporter [Treponema sp.]